MTNYKPFFKENYYRWFGLDSNIDEPLSCLTDYLDSQEYQITDEEMGTVSYAIPNDSGHLVIYCSKPNSACCLVSIGKGSILLRNKNCLIDFVSGEMRLITKQGFVFLPSYNHGKMYYFSKGNVAFLEAVLSRTLNSNELSSSEIMAVMEHTKSDETRSIDISLPHKETLHNALKYAFDKSNETQFQFKTGIN